jgi:hypothetical protein
MGLMPTGIRKLEDGTEEEFEITEEELERGDIATLDLSPPPRVRRMDIWRRALDFEVAAIEAHVATLPKRQQMLFWDAEYFDFDDPMFPLIRAAFEATFGEGRTNDLLAPSE